MPRYGNDDDDDDDDRSNECERERKRGSERNELGFLRARLKILFESLLGFLVLIWVVKLGEIRNL